MAPTTEFGGRAFGQFVATSESHRKTAQTPASAGEKEWRREASPSGPRTNDALRQWGDFVFPGVLHIYDAETEQSFTITTNQGDSEILLVENNIVYYRVTDRLYSAPITEKGIGAATLIAKDDLIRDSHWAFIKH